eukprot:c12624_g1_i2.p1 GENE.c12624_g1_i2~~c12624_g1_i2.p1  ORF type:complete len:632 (+),score=162.65 c12624_g1_i2:24-1898(+)
MRSEKNKGLWGSFFLGTIWTFSVCLAFSFILRPSHNNINISKEVVMIQPTSTYSSFTLETISSPKKFKRVSSLTQQTDKSLSLSTNKEAVCPSSPLSISLPYICILSTLRMIVAFGQQFQLDIAFINQNSNMNAIVAFSPPNSVPLIPEISLLSDLSFLVTSAAFHPSIPSEIGLMTQLLYIDFRGSSFANSTLPLELKNLSVLKHLLLSSTQLRGKIPSELALLSDLGRLDLLNNNFTGPIPSEIGNLKQLSDLNLSFNTLHTHLPSELGKVTSLRAIRIAFSYLTGTIPTEFGKLIELSKLVLAGNYLSGTLPTELMLLSQLTHLDIAKNQLSGDITKTVESLKSLKYLYLQSNSFSGLVSANISSNLLEFECEFSGLNGCLQTCSKCELYQITFGICNGAGQGVTCVPCYYFLPVLFVGIGVLVFFLTSVFPTATKKHSYVLACVGSVFGLLDTVTDIGFALVTTDAISIVSWFFFAFCMVINVITIVVVISKSAKQINALDGDYKNSEFHRRFVSHEFLYAITVVILMMNVRMLPFVMNLSDKNTKALLNRLTASLVILFQDLPQLVLQIVVFVRHEETFFVAFSLAVTSASLLHELFSGNVFEPARRRMSMKAVAVFPQ